MAISEDLMGGVDVTSVATVPAAQRSVATFGSRGDGVVAGLPVAAAVIDAVCGAAASDFDYLVADGQRVVRRHRRRPRDGTDAAAAHRRAFGAQPALPPLRRRHADPPVGRRPRRHGGDGARHAQDDAGLRALEKYAVRMGGGANHRMGLSDAALVKDNHVMAAGGVAEAFAAVRSLGGDVAGGDRGRLDRRRSPKRSTPAPTSSCSTTSPSTTCAAAVAVRNERAPGVVLEASGGLTLEVARAVGETGVDYIAVGELTHSAPVLDIGLDLEDVLE